MILAEEPHVAEDLDARRGRRHERRDRAGQQATACWPPRRRPGPPSRAPRSAPASAPRRAPSSASGSTATTLEPRFRVIGVDAWSDEPGFADAADAGTGVTGICGSGIVEVIAELFLAGVITHDGVVDGSLAARTPRIVRRRPHVQLRPPRLRRAGAAATGRPPDGRLGLRIPVTQNDVRAIQLAKAALYAGVRLLMDQLGSTRSTRSASPAPSAARSTRSTRWSSGSSRTATWLACAAAGNAAGTGALIALLQRRRPARDRGGRPPGREDRDRGRAALPGALRRGDGLPPPDGAVPNLARVGDAAGTPGDRRRGAARTRRDDDAGRRARRAPPPAREEDR